MTTKLFAVLVGGKHGRATIELHDVQFVVARSIEQSVPLLRQRWWGIPVSLHVDAYAEIDTLDGYKVEPAPKGPSRKQRPFTLFRKYRGAGFSLHKNSTYRSDL